DLAGRDAPVAHHLVGAAVVRHHPIEHTRQLGAVELQQELTHRGSCSAMRRNGARKQSRGGSPPLDLGSMRPPRRSALVRAAGDGPNIWTACVARLMVTLLKRSASGFAGRFGLTTARRVLCPSRWFDKAFTNACPAGPDFDPMIKSMWATSFPSPTSDSPMKKSAAITTSRSG